jgi:hypothetical protein
MTFIDGNKSSALQKKKVERCSNIYVCKNYKANLMKIILFHTVFGVHQEYTEDYFPKKISH